MPFDESRSKLSQTGAVLGTFSYMAPEVFSGYGATGASDLFALSVALHELLTGLRPFPGQGRELAKNILEGCRNPMGHGIPKALRHLADALLRKEPGQRPSAAKVLETIDQLQRPVGGGWWAAGAAAITLAAAGAGLWASPSMRLTGEPIA